MFDFDAYQEAMEDEMGAYGDPRHCPHHPHVVTSSPDGLFDGVCGECEALQEAYREEDEALPLPLPEVPLDLDYGSESDIEF